MSGLGLKRVMLRRMQRFSEDNFLTDTCTIQRSVQVKTTLMVSSQNWEVVGQSLPCRLIRNRSQSASEIAEFGMMAVMDDEYRLVLENDADILADDRVVIGDENYQVTSIQDGLTDAFFKTAIICRKRGADFR